LNDAARSGFFSSTLIDAIEIVTMDDDGVDLMEMRDIANELESDLEVATSHISSADDKLGDLYLTLGRLTAELDELENV
jgi:hypothetical protein